MALLNFNSDKNWNTGLLNRSLTKPKAKPAVKRTAMEIALEKYWKEHPEALAAVKEANPSAFKKEAKTTGKVKAAVLPETIEYKPKAAPPALTPEKQQQLDSARGLLGMNDVPVTDPMYWRRRQNAANDLDLTWEETMSVDSGNMSPELRDRVLDAQDARALKWAAAVDPSTLDPSDALMHNAVLNGGVPTQEAVDSAGMVDTYMTPWGKTGGHQNNDLVTNIGEDTGVVKYKEGHTFRPSDAAQVGNYHITASKGGNAHKKQVALTALAMFAGPVAGALTAPGAALAGSSTVLVQSALTGIVTGAVEGDVVDGLKAGVTAYVTAAVGEYIDDRFTGAPEGSTADMFKEIGLPEELADTAGNFIDTNVTGKIDAAGDWVIDKVDSVGEYLDIATSSSSRILEVGGSAEVYGSVIEASSALPDWAINVLEPIKETAGDVLKWTADKLAAGTDEYLKVQRAQQIAGIQQRGEGGGLLGEGGPQGAPISGVAEAKAAADAKAEAEAQAAAEVKAAEAATEAARVATEAKAQAEARAAKAEAEAKARAEAQAKAEAEAAEAAKVAEEARAKAAAEVARVAEQARVAAEAQAAAEAKAEKAAARAKAQEEAAAKAAEVAKAADEAVKAQAKAEAAIAAQIAAEEKAAADAAAKAAQEAKAAADAAAKAQAAAEAKAAAEAQAAADAAAEAQAKAEAEAQAAAEAAAVEEARIAQEEQVAAAAQAEAEATVAAEAQATADAEAQAIADAQAAEQAAATKAQEELENKEPLLGNPVLPVPTPDAPVTPPVAPVVEPAPIQPPVPVPVQQPVQPPVQAPEPIQAPVQPPVQEIVPEETPSPVIPPLLGESPGVSPVPGEIPAQGTPPLLGTPEGQPVLGTPGQGVPGQGTQGQGDTFNDEPSQGTQGIPDLFPGGGQNPPELQEDEESAGVSIPSVSPSEAAFIGYLASQAYNSYNSNEEDNQIPQTNGALWDIPATNTGEPEIRPDYGPVDYGPSLQEPQGSPGWIAPSVLPASNSGQPSWQKYSDRYTAQASPEAPQEMYTKEPMKYNPAVQPSQIMYQQPNSAPEQGLIGPLTQTHEKPPETESQRNIRLAMQQQGLLGQTAQRGLI